MTRRCRRSLGTVRWFALGLALMGAASLAPRQAAAQAAWELNAVYGRGIHAYFAGQATEADRLFSEVIEAGSTDPRVYYFRAIARLRTGRQYEAERDMQLGALYEARDPGAAGSVGQALVRVQGPQRQMLEKYRREGRLAWVEEQRSLSQARYEQLQHRETEVLRQETPADLGGLASPGAAATTTPAPEAEAPTPQPTLNEVPAVVPPAEPAADADPFGAADAPAEPTADAPAEADAFGADVAAPAEPSAEPAAPVETSPVDAPPITPAPADDPFGAEAAPPTAEPATEEPAAAEPAPPATADPFGADSEDPFDADANAAPPAEAPAEEPAADPAPSEPAATGDDPFGAGAATPTAEEPGGEAAPPAATSDAQPGVLGRIFGRTLNSLTPKLPNPAEVLGGIAPPLGGPSGVPAESPEPGSFDLGPGDEPAAPLGDPSDTGAAEAVETAPAEAAAEQFDAFGDPAEDDPFFDTDGHVPAAEEAEVEAMDEVAPAEPDSEEPFGDEADPFGETTEPEATTDDADAETEAETDAGDDSEAGEDSETSAEEESAEEQPADDPPGEAPAGDDPFGGF